jgi:hypothetical protein
MLSKKGRGRHSNLGTVYFWCLFGVFVTMSALSFMRWAENYHLFILGTLSLASAFFGRTAVQRRWHQWPRLHLTGMGASYILMLTAFYVDNGKNCPCGGSFLKSRFGSCQAQSECRLSYIPCCGTRWSLGSVVHCPPQIKRVNVAEPRMCCGSMPH